MIRSSGFHTPRHLSTSSVTSISVIRHSKDRRIKVQSRKTHMKLPSSSENYEMLVGSMALRAMAGPPQWLSSAAYALDIYPLRHFLILFKPSHLQGPCLAFDFQPSHPESPLVAMLAVSGNAIPGIVKERHLKKVPAIRCWYLGNVKGTCIDETRKFNSTWDMNLKVGKHDCRHYTNALIEHITGKENVLESLIIGRLEKGEKI